METTFKEQIMTLLNEKGKSADTMTSALKSIGDGSMENGINKLARFMEKAGKNQGVLLGVVGTITIAGLIENKNISEIVKDINEDITKNMLLSKLSSIIFISKPSSFSAAILDFLLPVILERHLGDTRRVYSPLSAEPSREIALLSIMRLSHSSLNEGW